MSETGVARRINMIYKKEHGFNMNIPTVGIDSGESDSVAHYGSASGDILEHFCFEMNDEGFN